MSDTECDLEELTALLEEDDDIDDATLTTQNLAEIDNGDSTEDNKAHTCNGEKSSITETVEEAEGTFEELAAMIGQSDDEDDDDNDETWPGNRDGKVADTETEDEKGNKKVGDENSDNVETVNTVNEAGSPVNENIGNIANSIESKSGEENSELTDCCKNKDKKEQTKNIDVDQRNAVMEETLNTPKAPDPEFQVQTDNVVDINSNNGTESYGEQMEVGCAEGYGCFDDDFDPEMEEMMRTVEDQIEEESLEKETQCHKAMKPLQIKATKSQSDRRTENNTDTEGPDSVEDWFEETSMQDMDVEDSDSEKEEETTVTPSQADILAEMKQMQERMKQLEGMLVKSQSSSKSHAAASSKPSKHKTANLKKLHSHEKKGQSELKLAGSVFDHSDKGSSINSSKVSSKMKGKDNFKIKEEKQERAQMTDSETVKAKFESKNKKSPNSSEEVKDRTSEGFSRRKGHSDRREKSHHNEREKVGHPEKKRKRTDDLISKDEDNPFFAATPTSEDSSVLATDPRSLFGDSDDSDWEELDGEKKSNLSDEGRQINKLLKKGPGQRIAHTPKYDPSILKKSPRARWSSHSTSTANKPVRKTKPVTIKPQVDPETGTVSGKYTLREEYKPKPVTAQLPEVEEQECTTDPYCGIRIINPRISMAEFKSKMSGRAMVRVSHIQQKVSRNDLQKDNWVTIGVVVHKTEPRQSAAGKQFCIWKLSDLKDCDKTVSFFLFGNVYKEHWKNDTGTVIGLLNATMMDKSEKSQSEIAFTINHPQQMLIMGHSKDLGRCKGTTKAGNPCSQFINKSQGEFCTYHVTAAYKKSSAKRTELQASTGIAPKAFGEKGRKSKDSFWVYGGQTFTSMRPQEKSSKDLVTLKKLKQAEANKGAAKVTTMSLHELEPEDEMKFKKLEDKDAVLLEKLMVPTAGSMNLVKHLVKKDKPQRTDPSSSSQPEVESISAKDLLKQHQNAMKQRLEESKKLAATPTLGKGFSVGQDISLDVPVKKTVSKSAALAKSLAIAKLKEKGGVQKEDPNAVRKKLMSPEQKEKIRKRVAEDIDTESKDSDLESSEPPRKRSKFLGNVDLNDPEVQKLLKSRSKHKGALAEAEAEHEDKYFNALEKREKMEEKMDSVMEMEVKLFRCKQCQYTAYSLGDKCKKEQHDYQVRQGIKKFFKCRHCKKRTETCLKFPVKPCQDCGKTNYERVSMLKERKGPKLESEELSLRGNEQKYLGSLNQKNFVNL